MKNSIILILSFLIWTSCNRKDKAAFTQNDSPTKKNRAAQNHPTGDFESVNIDCDSVYPNRGYRITLLGFSKEITEELKPNTVFKLEKLTNGKYKQVFEDSIYCRTREVKFEDFNNDKLKDILVQNYSDVRSNLTYFLYLVDTANDRLKKIKGFEEIKNPHFLPKYNLIDNYVMSGRNWTDFYKIKNDSVVDFNIIVEEPALHQESTYEKDYKKAIRKILSKEK